MPSFWWTRMRAFARSQIFRKLLVAVFLTCLYTIGVNHVEHYLFDEEFNFANSFTAFLGATLSLLLVFRTNGAYDRWWEGRKQWGALVNHSRNLAIKTFSLSKVSDLEKEEMWHWIQAFPFVLMNHLRWEGDSEFRRGLRVPSEVVHAPGYVSQKIFDKLQQWRDAEKLDDIAFLAIDTNANALLDICGVCERILKTPLPLSHRALIPQVLMIYVLVVPWGVPNHVGSVALMGLLTYFMVGLELVAEGLEEPFRLSDDGLPLDSLCDTIKVSTEERLRQGLVEPTDLS
jgi:ion channel-forming bestrophin family protein